MKPTISVVVPAYNEEKLIETCLQSLKNQSYDSYEIIVVDNASTDRTSEIARKYANVVVHEPRKGVAFARQRGFQEASGDIIASTDADSILDKNWLHEIERSFSGDIICTYGPVYLLDGTRVEKALAKYGFTFFLKASHFIGVPNITGINFAVLKKAFSQAGGFDLRAKSAEDVTLAMKLKKIGRISFNPKLNVYTSARRLRAGWLKFLKHHTWNYLSVVFLRRTRDFEDIRE